MTDQTANGHTFNEAPASFNVKYISRDGFECQFTLRDETGAALMPKIESVMNWLVSSGSKPVRNGNGSAPAPAAPATSEHPAQPAAPQQPANPPAAAGGETIQVQTIAHTVTEKGVHFLKVKGGHYTTYGVKAWAEVIPQSCAWMSWPIGTEYQPPAEMAFAVVSDGEKKKVTAFKPAA